ALPVQAFDGELVVAWPERRAVERNPEVAVGVLGELIDDADAALVDAVDGDAKEPGRRARLVDAEIGELRAGAAADDDGGSVGGAIAARQQTNVARAGRRVERALGGFLAQRGDAPGLLGAAAGDDRERDAQDHRGSQQAKNDFELLPEGF